MTEFYTVSDFLDLIDENGLTRITGAYTNDWANPEGACAVGMGIINLHKKGAIDWDFELTYGLGMSLDFNAKYRLIQLNDNYIHTSFNDVTNEFRRLYPEILGDLIYWRGKPIEKRAN